MRRLMGAVLGVIALMWPTESVSSPAPAAPAAPPPVSITLDPSATDDLRAIADAQATAEAARARLAAERARADRAARTRRPARGDVWSALGRCESNNNPRSVSASGRYRGAFQFSLATWHSLGYGGDPIDHSYDVQLEAARKLQRRSGWGQWPTCARRLGLV